MITLPTLIQYTFNGASFQKCEEIKAKKWGSKEIMSICYNNPFDELLQVLAPLIAFIFSATILVPI